jgi:hypothetical protein
MRQLAFYMSVHAANAQGLNRTALFKPYFTPVGFHNGTGKPSAEAHAQAEAAQRAAAAKWTQRVRFNGSQQQTVHEADPAFVATAAAIGVAGVLAVLLLLYAGWWELERAPSLNLLETGLAMGAPLLLRQPPTTTTSTTTTTRTMMTAAVADNGGGGGVTVNSNADHVHIVARLGARRVRYGAVPVHEGGHGETEYMGDDDTGEPLHSTMDGAAYAALRDEQQQPLPPGYADGMVGGGHTSGAGGRMRLRLVDVDETLQRGVAVLTPKKGNKFD